MKPLYILTLLMPCMAYPSAFEAPKEAGSVVQEDIQTINTLKLRWLKKLVELRHILPASDYHAWGALRYNAEMEVRDASAYISPDLLHSPLIDLLSDDSTNRSENFDRFYQAMTPTTEHKEVLDELLYFYGKGYYLEKDDSWRNVLAGEVIQHFIHELFMTL